MVFDVAVKVHCSIQQTDIEVGRNLGNQILRWLHHVKPSGHIRVQPRTLSTISSHVPVHSASSNPPLMTRRPIFRIAERVKRGRSFFTPWNLRMRTFPSVDMIMWPFKPAGFNGEYRSLSSGCNPNFPSFENRTNRHEGVFRKDIAQWMQRNPWSLTVANVRCSNWRNFVGRFGFSSFPYWDPG